MEVQFDIINPINYPNWDILLRSNKSSSIFHTSAWAKVLYESYGYEPYYFAALANGRLSALIPVMEVRSKLTGRRGVSLPFSDYGNPIPVPGMLIEDAVNAVCRFGKKAGWRFLELRDANCLMASAEPSSCFCGHTLLLTREEKKIFWSFRSSTRRNVLKALQQNVKTEISHSFDALREFYRLHCLTRKSHGLPPQPFYFFRNIHEHIISKKMGFVVLAAHGRKNIAAAVCFHFNEKALYKYSASDRLHQHLRASNLVTWEAIKWYAQNGYKSFCFGRTELENHGLLQFKSGWGTETRPIKYYRYDLSKEVFVRSTSPSINRRLRKVFGKLPTPCLAMIGALSYRHIG